MPESHQIEVQCTFKALETYNTVTVTKTLASYFPCSAFAEHKSTDITAMTRYSL